MAFFKSKKKKKFGKESKIAKLKSPYLRKLPTPSRKARKAFRKRANIPTRQASTIYYNRGKNVLVIILSLGIIAFGIYAVFFSDYFLVQDFEIEEEGTLIEDNEVINQILRNRLGQNLVLINEKEIIDEITEKHPEIDKIVIKKIFPEKIRVEYEKYPTIANLLNMVDGIQKKFLVDSRGFLTEENTENPNLPYIKMETSEALSLRTTFLPDATRSEERLTYMINAVNLFEEKFGMKLLHAEYFKKERELHLYTEKLFYVMLDMEKDLNTQINKLKKSLSKLDIYNVPLLYIDLRISGTNVEKVIYKRK